MDDDWGYPYFRKPPYVYVYIYICICICICTYILYICIHKSDVDLFLLESHVIVDSFRVNETLLTFCFRLTWHPALPDPYINGPWDEHRFSFFPGLDSKKLSSYIPAWDWDSDSYYGVDGMVQTIYSKTINAIITIPSQLHFIYIFISK